MKKAMLTSAFSLVTGIAISGTLSAFIMASDLIYASTQSEFLYTGEAIVGGAMIAVLGVAAGLMGLATPFTVFPKASINALNDSPKLAVMGVFMSASLITGAVGQYTYCGGGVADYKSKQSKICISHTNKDVPAHNHIIYKF